MKIPFLNFTPMHASIQDEMVATFKRVYSSNWFVLGEEVKVFETAYAQLNQVGYAIGVSNGLDALYLALKACGVQQGDEVIVPSNTYIATALAVCYLGAKPVFVEPRLATYNINPELIEKALTSKTKVIMPVHLYGQACEMSAIMQIAEKHCLKVVEDNAQAHLATFKGKLTGSWGHVNGTSFYPGKNLGALGDAGAVTTNDDAIADQVRILRNYGSRVKYKNEVIGHNMRLDELQAAFLSVKMKHLNKWTLDRKEIALYYDELLKDIGDLVLPQIASDATHVYHLYVVRSKMRDALQKYLTDQGVGTLIHYPIPPHLQHAYNSFGYKIGNFPIAEKIANTCLSLPIWPGMKTDDVKYVAQVIKTFFNN
jgi:dTDP-4-amino-4,6-dideoxygalactose transaminase